LFGGRGRIIGRALAVRILRTIQPPQNRDTRYQTP
jgi:hypothetical protein